MIDQILRSAGWVNQGGCGSVNSKIVVQGGDNLLHMYGTFNGMFAKPIGGSDRLTGSNSATC
jgi:hypothetical protein